MNATLKDTKFNGDISNWNTSNVNDMYWIFFRSVFNGDISRWDVSKVCNMSHMFYKSRFKGNISSWNRFSVTADRDMFLESKIAKDMKSKSPSFEQVKSHCLNLKLEADLQKSPRQREPSKVRL